ncbi:hypothetical protein CI603_01080 [Bifidobacterium sp. wkB338]|nr:hypothetical protein CI603_01080 [Bifidobacterium sp. wkB338]
MWAQTHKASSRMDPGLLMSQTQRGQHWRKVCQELRHGLTRKGMMMTHTAILKCRMATLKALPPCLTLMYCMCS